MKKIEVIAFKGCQTAMDFQENLQDVVDGEGLDAQIELVSVSSADQAQEKGLYGSPTLLVDGVEYQKERKGPPGFYCRTYLTAEGVRRYPLFYETVALLQGESIEDYAAKISKAPLSFPTLLTAKWCILHKRAMEIWTKATEDLGVDLHVMDVSEKQGEQSLLASGAGGIPCLIYAPGSMFYGVDITVLDARALLEKNLPQKQKKQVLLIDDEPNIREMLRFILEDNGYEVTQANDGEEGMEKFRESSFDLIVTDIFMPRKDGFEVFREVRETNTKTKFIVLSGGGDAGPQKGEEYLSLFQKLGVDAILSKPVVLEELMNKVKELVPIKSEKK